MKNAKKLLAVLIVVMMTLALAIPAFAAVTYEVTYSDGTHSKAIENSNTSYTLLAFDATDLSSDLVLPDGREFKAWEIDGVEHAAGATVTLTGPVNVKAVYTNTLTINGTTVPDNHVFKAYQIFAGKYNETDDKLQNIVWGSGFDTAKVSNLITDLKATFTDTTTYAKILALDSTDPAKSTATAVADAISVITDGTYTGEVDAAEKLADIFAKYTSSTCISSTETEAPYTIKGLADGYYLVKDTSNNTTDDNDVVSDFIMRIINGTEVTIKGDIPTVDKKVSTDAGANYYDGEATSPVNVQIGDILDYEIIGTFPTNYDDYSTYYMKFIDTIDGDIAIDTTAGYKVYVDNSGTLTEVNASCIDSASTISASGLTVIITDTKSLIDTSSTPIITDKNSKIVVKYKAEVLHTTVAGTPDPNEAKIEYSKDPNSTGHGTTEPDVVYTVTQSFKLVKFDGADNKLLAGATFELKIGSTAVKLYKVSDILYHIADSAEITAGTNIVTSFTTKDLTAAIVIEGLDEDVTYTLTETAAPAGYNLPSSADTTVTVSSDTTGGIASISTGVFNVDSSSNIIAIENNSGMVLPETGGMGTVLFITIGAILFMAAGIVLTAKKRLYNEG